MPCSRQSCSTVFCPTWPSRRMATICSSVKRFFITALSGPRFYRFKLGHFRGAGHAVIEEPGLEEPFSTLLIVLLNAADEGLCNNCAAISGGQHCGSQSLMKYSEQ